MDAGPQQLMATVSQRRDFVAVLADRPMEKRELVDRVGVSRSTVNRAVWDLEKLGLVEYADDAYRLTLAGRLCREQFLQYEGATRAIADANDLLERLPPTAPMSVAFLRGADVYVAEDPTPHVPVTVLCDVLEKASRLRGLSRAHAAAQTDSALRRAVDSGATIEMVFREAVYEHIHATYDWADDAMRDGSYRPSVTDDVPYGLAIADHDDNTVCCLVVYDNSSIAGVLVNDTPAAIDWATSVYESYRDAATPVSEREAE